MKLAASVLDVAEIQEDRSVSGEGMALRKSLADATAPALGRDDEILVRAFRAAAKAREKNDILVDAAVFGRAIALMSALPIYYPSPTIVVEDEDEIGLDWDEGNRRIVSLTVDSTSSVGFAALFGEEPIHGSFKLGAQRTPDTLRFLLGRLYPKHR
jgi:hypothetical protein